MEQIQQHEWTYRRERCIHCNIRTKEIKIGPKKIVTAFVKGIVTFWEEPPCITRPVNAPQRNADENI